MSGRHAAEIGRNVLGANLPPGRRHCEPPAGIDELADVARPIESHERGLGRRGQQFRLDSELMARDPPINAAAIREYLRAAPATAGFRFGSVEPVQQVFAEVAGTHARFQVLMSRG